MNTGGRERCEYLVVGTGAGGSTAGRLLADAGKDVLFLEEGGYHPTNSFSRQPAEMTARLYRNQGIFPILGKPTIALAEGCCVGGSTVINGGLIWRTPPWVLDEWKNQLGLSGFDNASLQRHFETVERNLNVVRNGVGNNLDSNSNLDSQLLAAGADTLDWKYVMVPRAVKGCKNTNACPTGCPTGAKQSMLESYLPSAKRAGARILPNCRVTRVHAGPHKATHVTACVSEGQRPRQLRIDFDHLILAAGAVQTPHLLRRSRLSSLAGRELQFHLNLKIVARFDRPIDPENGTMFTVQMQEFEREGTLVMPTNVRRHYLALALGKHGPHAVQKALQSYEHHGIFVAMIRPRSRARILSCLGDQPLVRYRLDPADVSQAKRALRQTAEVLFAAGAVELYLPLAGLPPVTSLTQLDRLLEEVQPSQFDLVTVHVMASCRMGPDHKTSVLNESAAMWDMENVTVADASMLPSNIGESPQGTIMAFTHEVTERLLESQSGKRITKSPYFATARSGLQTAIMNDDASI